ncbi:MAG: hypothetical protein Q8865_06870 [Bacillota bacterium]|nr:hypothetical protein [Bacillota bacterium]
MDEIDKEYTIVREYIYKNKSANVKMVAEETGVDEEVILEFLREGRLSLKEPGDIRCERCNTPIETGKYCDQCLTEIRQELTRASKSLKPKGNSNNNSADGRQCSEGNDAEMHIIRRRDDGEMHTIKQN